MMADSENKSLLVDSERLRYLVKGRSRLALIVLNACLGTQGDDGQPFSSVASGLVKSGIPAVIAMQFEISDESARVIAKTFYTSLALNMPVDAALTEARLQIFLDDKNNLEWATPILYMQVPDGQLFEFKGPRPKSVSANLDSLVQSPRHDANRADQSPRESQAQAGWKDRLYQFGDWFTSTPEVQYKPEPGAEPPDPAPERNVVDRGRQIWNDWFGSRNPSAPRPRKARQTLPPAQAPAQPQLPPPVMPAQMQTRPEPVERLQFQTSPPPTAQPQEPQSQQTQPQPASGRNATAVSHRPESRIYQTPLVPTFMADTIRQYFVSQRCESQVLQQGAVWVTQGRKKTATESSDASLAATIVIERSGSNLRVSIGGGRWLEPGSSVELSADPVATLITGPIAMDPQRTLISILWDIVDTRVTRSNGRRIA